MKFVEFDSCIEILSGKRIAIVGSAPSVLENESGFIDGHDIVIRVNNYKTGNAQGKRCDVHYSFYGTSIRKMMLELKQDKVKLCMCKLPNSKPLESEWHERMNKPHGVDYRYIYELRKNWWFCDTFIPDDKRFIAKFELLGMHQPSTGFAAILDVLECNPSSIYLTGFDFFTSGIHNVNEPWTLKNITDPIRHRPDLELEWLKANAFRFQLDKTLVKMINE